MTAPTTAPTPQDYALIYYSSEDACWVAHSLETDQIGTAGKIINALADLIRAIRSINELAKSDDSIRTKRKAAPAILEKAKTAQTLPPEAYAVADKISRGVWPSSLRLVVDLTDPSCPAGPDGPVCITPLNLKA